LLVDYAFRVYDAPTLKAFDYDTPVTKDEYSWEHFKWEYYYNSDGSRVLVRTERRARTAVTSPDDGVEPTITIDSSWAGAWESSLDAEMDPDSDDCSVSGNSVSCTVRTDRATAVLTRIAVSFE
jgi:hypothetical protein